MVCASVNQSGEEDRLKDQILSGFAFHHVDIYDSSQSNSSFEEHARFT